MILFISGTGTNVGKTTINMRLNAILMQKGFYITSLKPIETGVLDIPQDAMLHSQNQSQKRDIKEICFYAFKLPASPFVADSHNIIDVKSLKYHIKELEANCDILIIEGAGGLFVPITKDYFFIDLIKDLNAFCLLVSNDKLGCINEILIHNEALKTRKIPFINIINLFNKIDFFKISYPFLKHIPNMFVFQTQENELVEFLIYKILKNIIR